jgi:hypothetical protein
MVTTRTSGRGVLVKATTVEHCRTFDLGLLARDGFLQPGRSGSVQWLQRDVERASVGFFVRPGPNDSLTLWMSYSWQKSTSEPQAVHLPIQLEKTRPNFGGVRWWCRCPLLVSDVPCNRRVVKLYLSPSSSYFGCRSCHRLTYTSAQEHDKRVDWLRNDPDALEAIISDPRRASSRQLILALKALRKWRR